MTTWGWVGALGGGEINGQPGIHVYKSALPK